MTLTEDVLGWIESNWPDGSFPRDLTRVNRNDSKQLEQSLTSLTDDLQRSNYVGVGAATTGLAPIGTEFGYVSEPIVSVRVVGMDSDDKFGHIADHAEFRTLVNNIRTAIRAEDEHPATTGNGTYHTILEQDLTDLSANYRDYYLATWDLQFRGYDGFQ